MAVRFSESEILTATGAKRLREGARASYAAVCTDTRQLTPGCLFVALRGERFDAHSFLMDAVAGGAAGAVVCARAELPSLPRDFGLFGVEDTLAALGGLARLHRQRFRFPVGAVAGSNGKTTTKEMVAAILATRGSCLKTQGNLNNEVGLPLTLFGLSPEHVAAVVELGMNHPGELSRLTSICAPDAALLTVIQEEHLEGLLSLAGVAEAEGELFRALPPEAVCVVNLDDPHIVAQAARSEARRLTFGTAAEAEVRLVATAPAGRSGLAVTVRHGGADHPFTLSFLGAHNAHNAAGAFAMGLALGYGPEECARGLEAARPYQRRLNPVDLPSGVTLLDDCYNSNPGSVRAALAAAVTLAGPAGRVVAVLGDMLELGAAEQAEHVRLGEHAAANTSLAAFFGPRSGGARQTAAAAGLPCAHFLEVPPLLEWLGGRLRAGDVVLVKGSRGMRLERVVEGLTAAAEGGS